MTEPFLDAAEHGLDVRPLVVVAYDNRTYGGGPTNEEDTRWFIENLGEYIPFSELEEEERPNLHCHAECCEGRHASEVYDESNVHDNVYPRIWLHEVFATYRSFQVLREGLSHEQAEDFYRQRSNVTEAYQRLL